MRRAVAALVVGGALLAQACAGCAALTREDEWVPLDEALATRDVVRQRTQDITAVVVAQGLTPFGATGDWASCTDDSYAYQYTASAIVRATGPSSEVFDSVVAAVDAQSESDPLAVTDQGDRLTARTALPDVDLTMHAWTASVDLAVRVFGPCLPIAEADRDLLDQGDRGSQYLEIGGIT